MITSKFFVPMDDTDEFGSKFCYRPFKLLKDGLEVAMPISLVFRSNALVFTFTGKIRGGPNERLPINRIVPLLIIPLIDQGNETMDRSVQRVFNHRMSIDPFDWSDHEDASTVIRYQYQMENGLDGGASYSQLSEFGFSPDDCWANIDWAPKEDLKAKFFRRIFLDFLHWANISRATNRDLKAKFLRKLLLDFLDDFFNSNVFNLSPMRQAVAQQLLASDVIRGIYLKAELYIRQQVFKNAEAGDNLACDIYFKALDNWTEFICDPEHSLFFAKDKLSQKPESWFSFQDEELSRPVMFNRQFIFHGNKRKDVIAKRTVQDLVRNYEVSKAMLVLLSFNRYWLCGFLILFFLPTVTYFVKTLNTGSGIRSDHLFTGIFVFTIFGGIAVAYNFAIYLRIQYFGHMLTLTPFLAWAVWLYSGPGMSKLYNSDWSFLIIIAGISTLLGIFFFLVSIGYSFGINILLPRLQMAVITAWLAILPSLDVWKNYFDIKIKDAAYYGTAIILFTACYVLFEIRRNTKLHNKTKLIWKLINVILPGYLLSLSIGTVGMAFVNQKFLLHSDFFENKIVRENIYELQSCDSTRTVKYNQALRTLLGKDTRGREQAILNLVDYKTNPDSMEVKSKIYERIDHLHLVENGQASRQQFAYVFHFSAIPKKSVIVIPGFLVLMSAIALFSGIFLTLLFDDKPITDPL